MRRILELITAKARQLGRGLIKDPGIKVIALLFAIILWSSAMTEANPMTVVTLRDMPVAYRGMDALNNMRELAISGDPESYLPTVDVRLQVPRNEYLQVSRGDITLYVDLANVNEDGLHTLRIDYVKTRASIQGVTLTPAAIESVPVETMGKRAIPVKPVVVGVADTNYWYGPARVSPTIVQITGPTTTVSSVDSVAVYLDVTGVTSTIDRSASFVLLDAQGNEIDAAGLNFSTPNPVVSMQILPTKTLPVDTSLALSGEVDTDYTLVGVTSYPLQVKVAGEQHLLDALTSVQLAPVDITGLKQDRTLSTNLRLPEGVSLVDSAPVLLSIRVDPKLDTKVLDNLPVEVTGLGQGRRVRGDLPRVDVQITLPVFLRSELNAGRLQLYVDASGLGAGTHTLDVICQADADLLATNVLVMPATVGIQIE